MIWVTQFHATTASKRDLYVEFWIHHDGRWAMEWARRVETMAEAVEWADRLIADPPPHFGCDRVMVTVVKVTDKGHHRIRTWHGYGEEL